MQPVFERVVKATVKIIGTGGQGVLIPGGFIVTAAHCIKWSGEGGMVLGDHYVETVKSGRKTLHVGPLAVEPVADIAVLGALDGQTFYDWYTEFEEFCEAVEPVPLCEADFPVFEAVPVRVWSHKRRWLDGTAQQCNPSACCLVVQTEKQMTGGTSGAPIVNGAGELVAIVSNASEGKSLGWMPRPHLTLPVWTMNAIRESE